MTLFHAAVRALPLAAAACVAYDTAGPPVPSIDGTYMVVIAVRYSNYVEVRSDTLRAAITLHDVHYRGQFEGAYVTAFGDSGRFAGVERPESTLVVNVFGSPPKPIAYVAGLRQLYPWCDFPLLGTGALTGRLRRDSLLVDGQGSLPCRYTFAAGQSDLATDLQLRITGIR